MAGMPGMPGTDHHGMAHCPHSLAGRPAEDPHGGSSAPAGNQHHGGCNGACCTQARLTLTTCRLAAVPVLPARVVAAPPHPTRYLLPRIARQVTLPPPLGPPTFRA